MAEIDRHRVARMFAADAKLDVRLGLTAAFNREFDEFADARLVKARERILIIDLFALILVVK